MNDREANRPHTVYRYFDADGALLYVGSTVNFPQRDEQHKTSARWHSAACRSETEEVPDMATARDRERELIATLLPLHNVKHHPTNQPDADAHQPNIRVAPLSPAERGAINILTTDERKAALLDAARVKAASLSLALAEGIAAPKKEQGR